MSSPPKNPGPTPSRKDPPSHLPPISDPRKSSTISRTPSTTTKSTRKEKPKDDRNYTDSPKSDKRQKQPNLPKVSSKTTGRTNTPGKIN